MHSLKVDNIAQRDIAALPAQGAKVPAVREFGHYDFMSSAFDAGSAKRVAALGYHKTSVSGKCFSVIKGFAKVFLVLFLFGLNMLEAQVAEEVTADKSAYAYKKEDGAPDTIDQAAKAGKPGAVVSQEFNQSESVKTHKDVSLEDVMEEIKLIKIFLNFAFWLSFTALVIGTTAGFLIDFYFYTRFLDNINQ